MAVKAFGWEDCVENEQRLIFVFILYICLLDIVLILKGEIMSWSLMGVKWLELCISAIDAD